MFQEPYFAMMHDACTLQQERNEHQAEDEVEQCDTAASFDEPSALLQRSQHHSSARTGVMINHDVALVQT